MNLRGHNSVNNNSHVVDEQTHVQTCCNLQEALQKATIRLEFDFWADAGQVLEMTMAGAIPGPRWIAWHSPPPGSVGI